MPHTLLLLADVSLPLQEEEQIAWKRLIRVLGHELSNSLAPIKSIAGSLLARVDNMEGDDATLHDFRRGLGVVESRADALHRFVQSYRQLAQLPPPQLRPVALGPLLERVVLLEQRLPVQLEAGPPVAAQRRSRSVGADVHQPAGQRRGRFAGQRRTAGARQLGASPTPACWSPLKTAAWASPTPKICLCPFTPPSPRAAASAWRWPSR